MTQRHLADHLVFMRTRPVIICLSTVDCHERAQCPDWRSRPPGGCCYPKGRAWQENCLIIPWSALLVCHSGQFSIKPFPRSKNLYKKAAQNLQFGISLRLIWFLISWCRFVLMHLPGKITYKEIDEMITTVDKNEDWKISYSEFRVSSQLCWLLPTN